MTMWRPGGGVRLAAAVVACALWSACSDDAAPATRSEEPLEDDLARALEIASDEWPESWILQMPSSRYHFDGDDVVLDDHAYVLVTDDGLTSYHLVRLHADDSVSSGPVAGRAAVGLEAFDFAENTITSVDAMDLAWGRLGAEVNERCGSPEWLDVRGARTDSGDQSWAIEYSTRGESHTVWIDAGTGAVTDIEEEPC